MTPEQIVSTVKDFTLAVVIFYFYTQANKEADAMRTALIASLKDTLAEANAVIRQQGVIIAQMAGVRPNQTPDV